MNIRTLFLTRVRIAAFSAILLWSAIELLSRVNPFRRILGGVVLIMLISMVII